MQRLNDLLSAHSSVAMINLLYFVELLLSNAHVIYKAEVLLFTQLSFPNYKVAMISHLFKLLLSIAQVIYKAMFMLFTR